MKKIAILLILILLVGCSSVSEEIPTIPPITAETQATTLETTAPITTIEQLPVKEEVVENKKFSKKIEAETAAFSGDIKVSKDRKGYTGNGYVTNFTKNIENKFEVQFSLEASQHYDITLTVASDSVRKNSVFLNGSKIAEFTSLGTGKFEKIHINGIFFEKGTVTLAIKEDDGWIDIDSVLVENNVDIASIKTAVTPTLINKNSNEKTKRIMQFLTDNYTSKTISGQYVSSDSNTEMEIIHTVTGKYPAMLSFDFGGPQVGGSSTELTLNSAIKWGQDGGLVSAMWHWNAPMNEPNFYSDKTTFDLSKAITKIDTASMSIEEITKLCDSGKIAPETLAIVKDIDNISAELKKFQDADVTVLWRPLHEASGGWFWWGNKGSDSYKWLWKLIVDRQTKYHQLNNLIWVWNGQSEDWYVGNSYCDMISADIYTTNKDYSSHVSEYIRLNNIAKGTKMLGISECGTLSDPDFMARDRSVWSFFGLWYGEYMSDEHNVFSDVYTSKEQLIKTYNSEGTITKDKLPDFKNYVSP